MPGLLILCVDPMAGAGLDSAAACMGKRFEPIPSNHGLYRQCRSLRRVRNSACADNALLNKRKGPELFFFLLGSSRLLYLLLQDLRTIVSSDSDGNTDLAK